MTAAADSNPPGELYCTTCEKTFHVGDRCPSDGTRLLKLKTRIDPFLGRDLDGRYTVLEKLGQGGMGAVYRAEQHSVGREVAVKVINTALVSEPEVIKRFLREARLASNLSHPNVVSVLDFGQTEDGVFYLVMELVSGRTLDQVIKSERVFKPERVVRIGTQILDALDGAHALSIVHRDLKPSNVILLGQGRDLVKVLDFGLAKSVSPDATSTTMTGAGAVLGTPAFMPPELATGQPCDARADLYSLGVMLYFMGSGRLPFVSESVHELVAMHGSDDPAPPMTGVPHRLAAVIDRLLRKNPDERYQSAAHALQALETSLSMMTPSQGVQVWPSDTQPSIGPFPATDSQFAHLETPVPPSLITNRAANDRKKPSATELERLVGGDTMLAGSAAPVAATSQPGLAPTSPVTRTKWPLLVGIGALAAIAVVAFALSARDAESEPAKPPAPSEEPVAAPPERPAENPVANPVAEPAPERSSEPAAASEAGSAAKKQKKRDKKKPAASAPTAGNAMTAPKEAPKEVPKEEPKEPPKDPGTGSGSAKKAPLPF